MTGGPDITPRRPTPKRATSNQRHHEHVLAFAASHPETCRLTVADLIARTQMSRSTLYRALRTEGGVDAFLFSLRLKAAYDLISEGALLSELPRRCGFSNASHLSRRFKAQFGLTPTAHQRASLTWSRHQASMSQSDQERFRARPRTRRPPGLG